MPWTEVAALILGVLFGHWLWNHPGTRFMAWSDGYEFGFQEGFKWGRTYIEDTALLDFYGGSDAVE